MLTMVLVALVLYCNTAETARAIDQDPAGQSISSNNSACSLQVHASSESGRHAAFRSRLLWNWGLSPRTHLSCTLHYGQNTPHTRSRCCYRNGGEGRWVLCSALLLRPVVLNYFRLKSRSVIFLNLGAPSVDAGRGSTSFFPVQGRRAPCLCFNARSTWAPLSPGKHWAGMVLSVVVSWPVQALKQASIRSHRATHPIRLGCSILPAAATS